MKKLIPFLTVLVSAGSAFGGQEVSHSKAAVTPEACFNAGELQLDIFGQYTDGNAPHAGNVREHGWGGGLGINYFFTERLGLGVDGVWLSAHDGSHSDDGDNDRTDIFNFSGSVIYRFPMDCLAPYIYAGGGASIDGDAWANVHGGVGVEYRFVPNRLAWFADARFTYFGDRYDIGDHNNISARTGLRWVF